MRNGLLNPLPSTVQSPSFILCVLLISCTPGEMRGAHGRPSSRQSRRLQPSETWRPGTRDSDKQTTPPPALSTLQAARKQRIFYTQVSNKQEKKRIVFQTHEGQCITFILMKALAACHRRIRIKLADTGKGTGWLL